MYKEQQTHQEMR